MAVGPRLNTVASDRVRGRVGEYVAQKTTLLGFGGNGSVANDTKQKLGFKAPTHTIG